MNARRQRAYPRDVYTQPDHTQTTGGQWKQQFQCAQCRYFVVGGDAPLCKICRERNATTGQASAPNNERQ